MIMPYLLNLFFETTFFSGELTDIYPVRSWGFVILETFLFAINVWACVLFYYETGNFNTFAFPVYMLRFSFTSDFHSPVYLGVFLFRNSLFERL